MAVKIVPAYESPEAVGILFSEYTDMLIESDSSVQDYLAIQHYEDEIRNLEVKYGLPDGRLYLAYWDGELAGCIGLRKIDRENGEMKRFYVRPQFRAKGIGRRLMEQIILDAKQIGYPHLLLDTLPFLESAIHMYKKYGFYEIESYNDSPVRTSIYMKLDLIP